MSASKKGFRYLVLVIALLSVFMMACDGNFDRIVDDVVDEVEGFVEDVEEQVGDVDISFGDGIGISDTLKDKTTY